MPCAGAVPEVQPAASAIRSGDDHSIRSHGNRGGADPIRQSVSCDPQGRVHLRKPTVGTASRFTPDSSDERAAFRGGKSDDAVETT